MKNFNVLVFAGLLASQLAAADNWDTVGFIRLDQLGNVAGKTVTALRRIDFGITNSDQFKSNVQIINLGKPDTAEVRQCNVFLGSGVVPGVLERLFLEANTVLTLDSLNRGTYYDSHYVLSVSMRTSSGSQITLTCIDYTKRLITLKDLKALVGSYFDFSDLLPKPPADRPISYDDIEERAL